MKVFGTFLLNNLGSNESLRRLIHNARPKISVDFAAADADNVVIQGHLTATRGLYSFVIVNSVWIISAAELNT